MTTDPASPMRDHIILYVNSHRHEIRGAQAWSTLSDFLRHNLRLVGTKVVCAEGDCGACSVLLGRQRTPDETADSAGSRIRYQPVDSCILFLFQLDLCHVITVEGLGSPDRMHPVQRSMVDHFGSQCGFCTPGFVTTLAGLAEESRSLDQSVLGGDALARGLSGNLCRCTGYLQILEAAESLTLTDLPALSELFPEEEQLADVGEHFDEAIEIHTSPDSGECLSSRSLLVPRTLGQAIAHRAREPEARIIAGATDLGVQRNKGRIELESLLVLGDKVGLGHVTIEENVLIAGACASWSRVLDTVQERLPQLGKILRLFGAPQIRNVATIGGNLVNASPIADSLPFLYVVDATLEITGSRGERRVAIEDFYRGYKDVDLEADELLTGVVAPLPTTDERLELYKMSRRRDLDISSFTAAIRLRFDGQRIVSARVAYGGVGPVVLRMRAVEGALEGRDFTLATMRAAGEIARQEIRPISDVRGSQDYRRQLAANVLVKYHYDCHERLEPVGVA